MHSRIILIAQLFVCACTGSGITFVHDDIYVKLRSKGHVTMGRTEEPNGMHGHESFKSKMSLTFRQLRISTPAYYDLFKTGSERFDLQPNGFWRFRDLSVEGMSMTMNLSALGILLHIKSAILKQNGQLQFGDDSVTAVKQGEVIITLQLTPSLDEDTDCIACQIDVGHLIQIELDVTHNGASEISDVISRDMSGFRSLEYRDGAAVYFPEKAVVDDSVQNVQLNITRENDNRHNIIVLLPAPLGQSMEVDFIFKVQEPNAQLPSTLAPEPEADKSSRKSSDGMLRDVEERSRDPVNNADVEPEPKVIQVQYTPTKSSSEKGQEYNNVIEVVNKDKQHNGSSTRHVISTLVMILTTLLCLL